MKQISEERKILVAFSLLLIIAIVMDVSKGSIKDGIIDRAEIGGPEKEYQLQLEIKDVLQDYEYTLNVPPMLPTKEEAKEYFESTVTQIEQDFEGIEDSIPIQTSYMEDVVKAKWNFLPFGIIDSTGKINYEKLEEDTMMQAEVKLICGEYERNHVFSFWLKKPQLTKDQELLQKIDKALIEQLQKEGNAIVELPTEIEGNTLIWKEIKEYVTPQMLFLELFAIVLFGFVKKRIKKDEEKKRLQEMELEYPDIVSQLSLLIGAGMTTRQAWKRMAVQYNFKKKHSMVGEKTVYEAILRMNGRLAEGVSERAAYEQFRTEIPASCYHKLMRILLGSLEMGSQGICVRLEEESRAAFEQRIILAKKRGEESSTKMLGPLMLQMLVVMGIVMFPALIGFQI